MSIDKHNRIMKPKYIHYIMYHVISDLNGLLGVYTTQHNEFILMFQRNVVPPSSRVHKTGFKDHLP